MRANYLKYNSIVYKEHGEDSPCKDVENISIIVHNKKPSRYKKRKKLFKVPQLIAVLPLSTKTPTEENSEVRQRSSMPELKDNNKEVKIAARSSDLSTKNKQPFRSNFIVNMVSERQTADVLCPYRNPMTQNKWRIYRCQLNTQEESCCCSCNSDAMFEVMKSLYDCYKKKNCDHCNCILCGHLPRDERRLGEDRKSASRLDTAKAKKARTKRAEKAMVGKSPEEKQKILEDLAKSGAPLPEGKTPSEKALIQKIKADMGKPSAIKVSSEKLRKAKESGLLTPLEGKTPQQKEKILRGLASHRIPLPEGKTDSEKKLIDKVRTEMGLPPEPKTAAAKEKYKKAMTAGVITPLEGKTSPQKEKILKTQAEMGVPLPEGRTPSEKALIAKIKASVRPPSEGVATSEKLRKAKAAGLLTPLQGKTPEQKDKIIRDLAKDGLPLPEGKTNSEKKLIDKVRAELGLPPTPKTAAEKDKYAKAQGAGLIVPLEGKSPAQMEKILKGQHDLGLPLPEGRTTSEKALIAKIKAGSRAPSIISRVSERLKKAKAAGFLTPLEGKTPEQKEKIIRGLGKHGLPLPEGKTPSEKKIIDKVRQELGLPPEPKSAADKEKYSKAQAAGLLVPLEGKSPAQKERILKGQHELGIPLPEGRTPSEKALISKIKAGPKSPSAKLRPSEKLRNAKAAGVLTPLEGKTPQQKEKILKGLAMHGLPLPEGKTKSEKDLISKVRADLGLPPEPKTATDRDKYAKAQDAGLIVPLDGKSPAEKEKILKNLFGFGIPLPEGRTQSEKSLIAKIKGKEKIKSEAPADKRSHGLLAGKPALLPEKAKRLDEKTAKVMKEGKGPSDECICDLLTPEKGRTAEKGRVSKLIPSKITSEKLKAAKAAGLLTPLDGKTPEQKEKIIRGLAKQGLPLPEGKTASEKKLIDKVRAEMGLPPEPRTSLAKEKYAKAQAAGVITPLEGKTAAQKEKILKAQADMGLPLPVGRTPSEKALISKVKGAAGTTPSEKNRKATEAGLLTPLEGKSPEQKEKILKGRVAAGLPLPDGKSPSEKELIKKVKAATGYVSPEGKTPSEKERYRKAKAAGLLTPLEGKSPSRKEKIIKDRLAAGLPPPEGKTPSEKEMVKKLLGSAPVAKLEGKSPSQKEKILRSIAKQGLPLPEGKSPSEKALIDKVRKETGRPPSLKKSLSERLKQAKAAGLLTPLEGKTPEQKEKILRNLVKAHHPLPEGKTPSEKALINKIRDEVGLPPEPKTPSLKEKYMKAQAAGIITPLGEKSPAEKEKILRNMNQAGLPLPEGRTPSEKSLVRKIKAESPLGAIPSEKIRAAKAAGLLTPLEGKTPAQKEKILRGLAKAGIPMPEAKTPSEKELIRKIRDDLGLPPEPKSPSIKEKLRKAQAAGIVTPLQGKSPAQKEKILRRLAEAGVPLPEGRTPSEKALINQIQAEVTPSKRRLSAGPPVTPSKRRLSLGPPALPADKARKLDQKTAKVMKEGKGPSDECICSLLTPESEREPKGVSGKPPPLAGIPSDKIRKAKAGGLLTPLGGKTPEQKEKILKGLAMNGLPLPDGKTASEKKLNDKVRTELGLPPEPKTESAKKKYQKALTAGMIEPLEGKSPAEKEKILKNLAKMGIPLPEGRTPSEKSLIAKVKAEAPPPSQAPSAAPLAPEITPSQKMGKIKTKSKRIGASSRTSARGISPSAKAAGIHEEHQDIDKTTTCDRACGCDKKKIRFKHSYVKIRVTSPDISSLCPCPDECIPGVKHGVFTDNEGIKVTVGSAVGVPSYSVEFANKKYPDSLYFNSNYVHNKSTESILDMCSAYQVNLSRKKSVKTILSKKTIEYVFISPLCTSCSEESKGSIKVKVENGITDDHKMHSYICDYVSPNSPPNPDYCETFQIPSITDISKNRSSLKILSESSFDSIVIVKTESSLSLSCSDRESMRTLSLISIVNSSVTSHTSHYLCYSRSETAHSDETNEDSEYFTNIIDYSAADTVESKSSIAINKSPITNKTKKQNVKSRNDVLIFRMSGTNIGNVKKERKGKNANNMESIFVFNNLDSNHDIKKLVGEILSQKLFTSTSSIFVVVPVSDCDTVESGLSSTICIHMSEHLSDWKNCVTIQQSAPERVTTSKGLKLFTRGKQFMEQPTAIGVRDEPDHRDVALEAKIPKKQGVSRNKYCQAKLKRKLDEIKCCGVSMDTTSDRPCCCSPKISDISQEYGTIDRCVASVVSELITPMIVRQGVAQGLNDDAFRNIPGINLPSLSQIPRQLEATPVRHCKVPVCTGHKSCHELLDPPMSIIRPVPPIRKMAHKPYSSSRKKSKELTLQVPKETKCVGVDCNMVRYKSPTKEPRRVAPDPIIRDCGQADASCATCSRPNLVDGKTMSCLCSGVEKKIKLRPKCPCEHHQPPPSTQVTGKGVRSVGCQQCCDNKKQKSSCTCKENRKGRNKNVICECPYEEEEPEQSPVEELHSEDFEWVDKRYIRKMKSDLTQTTSGFKMMKKKRPPLEKELSFEEALSYYKAFSNEDLTYQSEPEDEDVCRCEDDNRSKTTTKNVYCECPYDDSPSLPELKPGFPSHGSLPESSPDEEPEEPLRGLKFVVGGKGSGSKGLSGVCCFDMLHESKININVAKTVS